MIDFTQNSKNLALFERNYSTKMRQRKKPPSEKNTRSLYCQLFNKKCMHFLHELAMLLQKEKLSMLMIMQFNQLAKSSRC